MSNKHAYEENLNIPSAQALEMRCCEVGPSVVCSLQRSQCTIQTSQLRKRKPSDFNTITEHASSKTGEEANPCLCCLLQGDAALLIATLREILICASCFLLSHCDSLLYIHCDRGKEIHYRFVAAVGPLPQSIYPSVSSCKTQGTWYLFTSWEEESVLTPPVRSDVISGKGRALEALSWPRHMRYVRGRESHSDDRAGQIV